MEIYREITPLASHDCFTIFSREKQKFDFPLHFHEDVELNLILNGSGAQRIVGDHIGDITDKELVLVSSNLTHGWFSHNCTDKNLKEVTIQFHRDLFDERFLSRNQLVYIRNLLDNSKRGVMFSADTIDIISHRILSLGKKMGFDSVLELLSIIHDLSLARDSQLLSNSTFTSEVLNFDSHRIENVFEFMNNNFSQTITLSEVAAIANMSDVSFSRFIKKNTGYSFIDSLNDIRLGNVTRLLLDTNQTIADIAFGCGFNNIANFNRIFKKKKGLTPNEFRKNYEGKRIFV